jgi:hypothetical protein
MPDLSLQIAARIALTTGRVKSPGVLKNSCFVKTTWNLRDRKCLPKRRSLFVCLPIAKFFRPFSGE